MQTFLENHNWRYAVKQFDASLKISPSDLNFLKEATRISTSAFGLQPYKVLIIDNPEIRAQLLPAAYGQSQVTDASHLFVFANYTKLAEADINAYTDNIAATRGLPADALTGFGDSMKNRLLPLSEDVIKNWTAKQAYIALGNLISAAAELRIDAGAMEGFNPQQFNEILGLDKLNLNAAVIAAVGYRHKDDAAQHNKKVRKPNEELFITL